MECKKKIVSLRKDKKQDKEKGKEQEETSYRKGGWKIK